MHIVIIAGRKWIGVNKMILKRSARAVQQRNKKQKPSYKINIPMVFSEIMGIDEKTVFELTLTENKEIIVKVVE